MVQLLEQVPSGLPAVIGMHDRADHRRALAPGHEQCWQVGRSDSTDGEDGALADGHGLGQELNTHRAPFGFNGCGMDRAEAEIVDRLLLSLMNLIDALGAAAQQSIDTQQIAGHLAGHVLLAKVHPIRINRQGQINTVVDD